MKILGYVWKVIVNLITIFIVISIFDIASSDFETAVFAILILIYLSINAFASSWGMYQIEFSEALDKELKDIKKLIQDPKRDLAKEEMDRTRMTLGLSDDFVSEFTQEIDEHEKEAQKEKTEKKKTLMVKFYINVGFQFIVYIIALYKLLSVF